ncbi:hypothetical protein AURDEDRAFT_128957 [Auricularia subglabra TFB-10046 SS5]|nr:hypothetical protein AURDEDRAFT_128957 [Auricularia subglabra TFB-10046 SS5]
MATPNVAPSAPSTKTQHKRKMMDASKESPEHLLKLKHRRVENHSAQSHHGDLALASGHLPGTTRAELANTPVASSSFQALDSDKPWAPETEILLSNEGIASGVPAHHLAYTGLQSSRQTPAAPITSSTVIAGSHQDADRFPTTYAIVPAHAWPMARIDVPQSGEAEDAGQEDPGPAPSVPDGRLWKIDAESGAISAYSNTPPVSVSQRGHQAVVSAQGSFAALDVQAAPKGFPRTSIAPEHLHQLVAVSSQQSQQNMAGSYIGREGAQLPILQLSPAGAVPATTRQLAAAVRPGSSTRMDGIPGLLDLHLPERVGRLERTLEAHAAYLTQLGNAFNALHGEMQSLLSQLKGWPN